MKRALQTLPFLTMTPEISGCISPEEVAEACLDDAADQTSAAVLKLVDLTRECVTFKLENDPVPGNGISCFASNEGNAWNLEGEVRGDGYLWYCGLNGSTEITCVETSDDDKDGKVTCEGIINIEVTAS